MSLSISLKELLFAYWNLLKCESNNVFTNNLSLIYEIVEVLNLSDEIKNVSFEDDVSYIGGYYNFKEKKLTLNIKKLLQLIAVLDMIYEYQQANIEIIEPTKKMCR